MRAPALLLGLALLLSGPMSPDAGAATVDRVAAAVNDDVITLSEVYDLGGAFIEERVKTDPDPATARREAELEVLDSLILRRLISQEILRMALDVDETELDRTIDDIARRNSVEREQLQREIEGQGLSWSDYREEVRESLRQYKFNEAIIRPRIAVDENELLDAYKRSLAGAGRPVIADVGAIFIAVPPGSDDEARQAVVDRALAAKARVQAGEDFAVVAAEVDTGLYGSSGGRMGTYRKGELVDTLDTAAFALEVGQLSDPILTPQGVFLLTVFKREQEAAVPFEQAREQLFEQVYSGRIEEETDQWYRQARRKSAVLVKLETPGG